MSEDPQGKGNDTGSFKRKKSSSLGDTKSPRQSRSTSIQSLDGSKTVIPVSGTG